MPPSQTEILYCYEFTVKMEEIYLLRKIAKQRHLSSGMWRCLSGGSEPTSRFIQYFLSVIPLPLQLSQKEIPSSLRANLPGIHNGQQT